MNRCLGLGALAKAARRPSGAVATYAEVLRDTYGASEIWPLVDIASGINIDAFINSDRDGTLTGWDLQNAAGPVTGTLAPYSDGANDVGDINTPAFALVDNPDLMSMAIWLKTDPSAPPASQFMWRFQYLNSNNYMTIAHYDENKFLFRRYAGGQNRQILFETSSTDWNLYGFSVDVSQNRIEGYLNGVSVGTEICAAMAGAGTPTIAVLGALTAGAGNSYEGLLSYFFSIYGSTWSDVDFLGMHNAASTAGPD